MLRAVLFDFDGTLVTEDILDIVCGIGGKSEESRNINNEFHAGKRTGLSPLITRINFLKGVTLAQIKNKLDENNFLMPGALELFTYLKKQSIITIIHSGNIVPILSYYQNLLGADYIVGTSPQMDNETIQNISEHDFPGRDFKVIGVKNILEKIQINANETVAIGDSPADKTMFAFAGQSIAINPKEGIEKCADYVIQGSLAEALPIFEALKNSNF